MLPGEVWRNEQRPELAGAGPVGDDVERPAEDGEHDLHVVRIAEVIHADRRMVDRIGGHQDDLAFAMRLHRIGQHDDAFRVGGEPLGWVVEVLIASTRRHCRQMSRL